MGVDIDTYRGRIGTFGHGCGLDVCITETVADFTRSFKSIGSVVFIGMLLVIAGVELNPGPKDEDRNTDLTLPERNTVAKSKQIVSKTGSADVLSQNIDNVVNDLTDENDHGNSGTLEEDAGLDIAQRETVGVFNRSATWIKDRIRYLFSFWNTSKAVSSMDSGDVLKQNVYRSMNEPRRRRSNDTHNLTENRFLETKLVKFTGLPLNTSSRFLEMVCQDKGEGKVHKVSINATNMTGIVEFEDSCAVQRLLNSPPIVLKGTEVNVMPYRDAKVRTIKVSNIPKEEDADEIIVYCLKEIVDEPILKIVIDREKDFAKVLFASEEAARRMAEEKTVKVHGYCLTVAIFDETHEDNSPPIEPEKNAVLNLQKRDVEAEPKPNVKSISEVDGIDKTVINMDSTVVEKNTDWTLTQRITVTNSEKTITKTGSTENVCYAMSDSTYVVDHTNTRSLDASRGRSFQNLLKELNLEDKYPGKMTISNVLALDLERKTDKFTHAHLPWLLLRYIILSHSECRDQIIANALVSMDPDKNPDTKMDVFKSNDKEMTCPLDILQVVIQCLDPFAQSFLFKKMYLCKLAIPFCSWQVNCQEKIVSLWPLRSILIEHNGNEFTAAQVPSHTIAFIRMGRPTFSKSKFLNNILSENGFEIFFNKDSPLGTTQRNISPGSTEMFWKLSQNNVLTFFNLRGDLHKDLIDSDLHFLWTMVDIVLIAVELDDIKTHSKSLSVFLKKKKNVILVVNNPRQGLKMQESIVNKLSQNTHIRIIVTHSNSRAISPLNLSIKMQTLIDECCEHCKCSSIELRLQANPRRKTDEHNIIFTNTRQQAAKVIDSINKACHYNTKGNVTPANTTYSKSLGMNKRKLYRSQMDEGENIKSEMKVLMEKQIKSISPTVKEFAHLLIQNRSKSVIHLQLFIALVSEFLDSKMREMLPKLKSENKKQYEALWTLQIENKNSEAIHSQEEKVKKSNKDIETVVFSVSHLFREIAHVYEACFQTNTPCKGIKLPDSEKVVDVFADLIINGYPFELLNGDDNYMPIKWIELVMRKVHERIEKEKVFAVSILGIQSSGKSTLLNTMFGSQFTVSAGRCTRGAHLQLLAVNKKDNYPFKYLLLIDTEGLRAPELENENRFNRFNHDNELATFVAGLGDMTILNIMGENMSEISEILQIMVHAFLRLKLANKGLDMNKSCLFVHHNVADITASEKMHQGFQKIMTTLDTMTKEAASTEGISDIVRFSQVINFDIKSHIWFFPNLWQGNPPFARVNKKYSEKVCELRSHMLMQAYSAQGKSYKTLDNTLIQIKDLWQGVLKEDFVFSFRNSIELKAYCWLEKKFQDILWKHERSVMHALQENATASFSKCDSIVQLESEHMNVEQLIFDMCEKNESSAEEMVNSLFENNEFKEIIYTWKDKKGQLLLMFWIDLRAQCKLNLRRVYQKRDVELKTTTMCQKHVQKLYDMSKQLATQIKCEKLNEFQKEKKFEDLWKEFERDLPINTDVKSSIYKIFELNLQQILHKHHTMLREEMEMTQWPKCDNTLTCLESSIANLCIEENDLSSTLSFEGGRNWVRCKKVKVISPDIKSLFSDLDTAIYNSCSTDCEISEQHVKEFLRKIEEWVNKIGAERDRLKMTLTSRFVIKINIYASRYAAMKFKNHNETYEQTYGITAHLLRYKQDAKVRLDAMIVDRSAEDTAAILFSSVIEEFVTDAIKVTMSTEVYDQLLQEIPRPKFHLMLEIVTDLAKTGEFKDWIKYLIYPKSYSRRWVEIKCENLLFGNKNNGEYRTSAIAKASVIFAEIKNAICKSLENETEVRKTDAWIQSFVKGMVQYPISSDKFNNVIVGFKEITANNVAEFSSLLLEKIDQCQRRINVAIQQTTNQTVVWGDENPYKKAFDRVWGCTETCPFCGETCARNAAHTGIPHHCIQHRPTGCIGVRDKISHEISLPSCNYFVQSRYRHNCAAGRFKCNENKSVGCPEEYHDYKEYKIIAPDWDIPPTPNMDDTSKIWMWFMGHFKEDLEKRFDVVVDNIPDRWSQLSKEDAIRSYGDLMSSES